MKVSSPIPVLGVLGRKLEPGNVGPYLLTVWRAWLKV